DGPPVSGAIGSTMVVRWTRLGARCERGAASREVFMNGMATALALLVLLLNPGSRPASAQESPDTITRGEHQCQDAFAHALASYSVKAGQCLAKCETSPGRSCGFFAPLDTITADCLSRASSAAQIPVLRQCAGTDCPECYD